MTAFCNTFQDEYYEKHEFENYSSRTHCNPDTSRDVIDENVESSNGIDESILRYFHSGKSFHHGYF